MGVWDKVKRVFFVIEPDPNAREAVKPVPPDGRSEEEKWLDNVIGELVDQKGGKPPERVATPEFWATIDALGREHPKLAAEWLEKFAVATPAGAARDEVIMRAAE